MSIMNDFCQLYWRLDSTTKTSEKVAALKAYLSQAAPADAAWAIYFLVGRRIKRLVGTRLLRQWAIEQAGLSDWLFEECYERVGDLAETISLILPAAAKRADFSLPELIEHHLLALRDMKPEQQKRTVLELWRSFDPPQLFVLGKLMTGGFRVGVSRRLVNRAIAEQYGIDPATIAHRLMGEWQPDDVFYQTLTDPQPGDHASSKPYPFFLANPLKADPSSLGNAADWIAEWKWDGIRAQVIRRNGETFIWSRGEELVTEQFPEVVLAADDLPDGTAIDGEILGWDETGGRPLEFSELQRRLGRKRVGKKLQREVPVVLLAFDLLEEQGVDIRELPLRERKQRLERLVSQLSLAASDDSGRLFADDVSPSVAIQLPPAVDGDSWQALVRQRQRSKELRAEGLMLKRRSSAYQVNRPVGDWWKWKVDPFTIDAVLVYAQRGHGRRASLYTDYTFAVWDNGDLVPFAKAYSGLSDPEIRQVDAFVRRNTTEKFGPVRGVKPELVFELAFENIQRSARHKSGIAVRFPRINRWRQDKSPADADHLATILAMLEAQSS